MQSINALSLTPDVHKWLANSRHPRILHIFDHACNLINERREILSIVTPQIGNGPFNLVIEGDVYFSDHVTEQSLISIQANQLALEDLTIHLTDPKLWSARPDWERLHTERDEILSQVLSLPNTNYKERCLDTPFAKSAQGYSTTTFNPKLPITNYSSPTLQFSNSLSSSLAKADLLLSLTAAQKLAGLGNGLTPAGDDFIMGALYSAWIIHPLGVATILTKEIANTAAPLTTSLSGAWLRSAGMGQAGILWHQYFDALLSVDLVRSQEAMDKILAVGETSGADAFAGFFGVFLYWADCV
jgi:hypothetical protein